MQIRTDPTKLSFDPQKPYAVAAGGGVAKTSLDSFSPGFFFFPKSKKKKN